MKNDKTERMPDKFRRENNTISVLELQHPQVADFGFISLLIMLFIRYTIG